MIKISIIIPMYNVEKYIEKCIYSAFNQELNETEFEIIAVNDESPDNSLDIITAIAKNHPNILVISQKNKGLGGARNTGILNASGEYLLFLDADDYLIKNSLLKILSIATANKLDILEFGAEGIDSNGKQVYLYKPKMKKNILSGIEYYKKSNSINSACNKLYRNNYLKQNNLLFVEKIYGEDFEFNTRALYLANRVMATNQIISKFLQSDNSITRSKDYEKKKKYVNDLINILRRINSFRMDFEANKQKNHDQFFQKRMTLINIDIFFMLFKNAFTLNEILNIRKKLKKDNLLKVNYSVEDIRKNIFRIVFLRFDFFFFKIALKLKGVLR